LTDVTFLVGDQKFGAHRCVLAAHSPIFQAMLYETNNDGVADVTLKKPVEVKILDVNPDIFKAFLTALYKDEIEITSTNLDGLMKVGRKYQVDKIKLLCAEFMEQDINKDNVIELFISGPTIMGDEEFGLKFIEEHADDVFKNDAIAKLPADRFAIILKSPKLKVDEIDVYKALVKWGEAKVKEAKDKTDLKTVTKDLIKLVRFPLMKMSDFATFVAPSNLIDAAQLVGLFSYLSVTDEKIRALLPDPGFETKEREGFRQSKQWTWNPLKKGSQITMSNNNLTITKNSSGWSGGTVFGTQEFKGGDQYWECRLTVDVSQMIGVAAPTAFTDSMLQSSPQAALLYVYALYGGLGTKQELHGTSITYAVNDVVGIHLAWNANAKTYDMNYYKNGKFMVTCYRNIPIPVVAAVELHGGVLTLDTNAKKPQQ